LYPVQECSTCAFPHKNGTILIGEKAYTNVCANTDVWLDGDFVSLFASLVCHNYHSLVKTALMKSGQDVPQLTRVPYPKMHITVNDYKALPSSIKQVVAVMPLTPKTIKVFDGLY
jgi:hypothetical protein